HHLKPSQLAPFRVIGDDLSDNALDILKIKREENAYDALIEYISKPEEEQASQAPRLLYDQMMRVPEWVDWDQICRGQQVLWKYFFPITFVSCYSSFVYTLGSPATGKVISSAGYILSPDMLERLIETSQFNVDISTSLENLKPGKGDGWKAILQARFLHSHVRMRLQRLGKAHSKYYDIEKYGVAINQEDLMVVLIGIASFTWTIMEQKLGTPMSEAEKDDYLHLWRYIGFLMGCSEETLAFIPTVQKADAIRQSLMLHVVDIDASSAKLVSKAFKYIVAQPIFSLSIDSLGGTCDPLKVHMALAEHVVGREVWTVLEMEPATWAYRIVSQLIFTLFQLEGYLAPICRFWWDTRKEFITFLHKYLMERIVSRKKIGSSDKSSFEDSHRAMGGTFSMGIMVFMAILITYSCAFSKI
ncbi:hypothetical protein BGW38_010273, partial [Lunasporangiospora selenospora]